MRAHRIVESQQPAELREVDRPEPGPGEVLIKVGGAGLCHSDLHLMHWPMPVAEPFTLGHETAGWVESVGAGVGGLEPGEPVIVHGAWGCGRCRRCQADLEQYCQVAAAAGIRSCGLGRDGGLAEYLLVPSARHLVPLGELDPRWWAPLDDAALTPYHAIKRVLPLCTPDSWAAVIGIGGLGHMAVQLLRELSGVRILAIDVTDEKLALALDLGATAVARGDAADAAEQVQAATGRQGAAVVLDCVGTDGTLALAAASVHALGHIVMIGIGMGTLGLSFLSVPMGTTASTTYWGTVTELREVVALAAADRLQLHVEQVPLEGVADAYRRLEAGQVHGRVVALPNG